MATAEDTVLVQIVTAANLAGINAVRTSLLGLNPSLLALAAVFAGVYEVGKAAVENSEAYANSQANLANAIKDRNAMAGQADDPVAISNVEKAQNSLAKAQQALGLEEDRLAIKRKITKPDLDVLKIKTDAVTKAQQELVKANAAVAESHQVTTYDQQALMEQIQRFMLTNRDFISNQNDVTDGFAAFIREGVPASDLVTAMNAAIDISIGEHISLADAVNLLQSAESGRGTGLKKLVGVQLESVSATATEADKLKTAHTNLQTVSKAYDGAKNSITPLQTAQNHLNQDWTNLTSDIGPGVVTFLTVAANLADAAVNKFHDLDQAMVALSQNNDFWAALQNAILSPYSPLGALATARAALDAPVSSYDDAAHKRPGKSPGSTTTVSINVYGQDPQAVARATANAMRQNMLTQ